MCIIYEQLCFERGAITKPHIIRIMTTASIKTKIKRHGDSVLIPCGESCKSNGANHMRTVFRAQSNSVVQ